MLLGFGECSVFDKDPADIDASGYNNVKWIGSEIAC